MEFTGIGPGPHCGMLLADLGAGLVGIDREGGDGRPSPLVERGRATTVPDVRVEEGRATAKRGLGARRFATKLMLATDLDDRQMAGTMRWSPSEVARIGKVYVDQEARIVPIRWRFAAAS